MAEEAVAPPVATTPTLTTTLPPVVNTELAIDKTTSAIANELRAVIRGEVRSDPFALTMYATDASMYEIEPLVVVYPRDEEDVRMCAWFAAKHHIPIIPRGAGSGLTGACLGRAIILDLNVHLVGILELDRQNETVAVEAGVTLDSLNRALKPYGFRVGPDPESSDRCTIGGMIANNSCGKRSLQYGAMRDSLISARVALADGTVCNFRSVVRDGADHTRKKNDAGLAGKLNRELPTLLKQHETVIETGANKIKAERDCCGYLLHRVNGVENFHPQRLLCGSEGTLGIVTEAVVKVFPLPGATGLVTVTFATLLDAAKAVVLLRQTQPVACELFDALIMKLARQARPEHAHLLPEDAGAMLALEYEDTNSAGVEQQIQNLQDRLKEGTPHQAIHILRSPEEQASLWATRKAATPLLFKRSDGCQPIPFVEDAAVPIDKLGEYVEKMIKIFEKYKLDYACYAHVGHGEPHFRPFMDLTKQEHVNLLEKVAGECHTLVWSLGGTISGEHGEGLVRAQWVEKQVGQDLYAVFKAVKDLFDPHGVFNPNKKITADPHLMLKNLRLGPGYRFSQGERPKPSYISPNQAANFRMFKPQTAVRSEMTVEGLVSPDQVHAHGVALLHWREGELEDETTRCNGNGHCRTTGTEAAMCPRFKYNRVEDASPRAKANVLRRMLNGRQRQGSFGSPEVVEIMDYCFNCKRCVDECPSNINIPKLAMEAKARYHMSHGLSFDKWLFVNAEFFFRLGHACAPLANTLNALPLVKWLVEKVTGIDRRRELPRFKHWRLRHKLTYTPGGTRPKVALYLDLYQRYCQPDLAQAAVDILEHHGFEVAVPNLPWTNMPALTHGAALVARKQIRTVTAGLAPFAYKDIPILTLEPTAALCMTEDFLYYVDTPESRAVARHTQDFCAFLLGMHRQKRFKTDFQRVDLSLAYLTGCHMKALGVGTPAVDLLRLVPGLSVAKLSDQVCCGMAGDFGMLRKHYDESMGIGRSLFLEASASDATHGCTESSGCAMQLEHGTGKPTMHPVHVLAQAYGLARSELTAFTYEPCDLPAKEEGHADDEHEKENVLNASVVAPTLVREKDHAHSRH